MKKLIILYFIWYQIGNAPVSPYIIELAVLELKRRRDFMPFLCVTEVGKSPHFNTDNIGCSNNSNDKSTGMHNFRILDTKAQYVFTLPYFFNYIFRKIHNSKILNPGKCIYSLLPIEMPGNSSLNVLKIKSQFWSLQHSSLNSNRYNSHEQH